MHYFAIGLMNENTPEARSQLLGHLESRREIFDQRGGRGTSVNPDVAEFDWLMIGGRFDGRLIGEPPTAYNNWLAAAADCPYYYWSIGHQAMWWEGRFVDPMELLWIRNTVPVAALPRVLCDVAITPEGHWIGSTEDGRITAKQWRNLQRRYPDAFAVGVNLHSNWRSPGCDCHIATTPFDDPYQQRESPPSRAILSGSRTRI